MDVFEFSIAETPVQCIRISRLTATVFRNLYPRPTIWKSIKDPALELVQEHRSALPSLRGRRPSQKLPQYLQTTPDPVKKTGCPRSRTEEHPIGAVAIRERSNHNTPALFLPTHHTLPLKNRRPSAYRIARMGPHTGLHMQEPPILFPQRRHAIWQAKHRCPLPELLSIEILDLESVLFCAAQNSLNDVTVWWPDLDHTAAIEKSFTAVFLERIPEFVGSLEKRHVGRVFKVGLPDDPGLPMRASQAVPNLELLKAQHVTPRPREVRKCRGAHPS